jgi:hypothetical protein
LGGLWIVDAIVHFCTYLEELVGLRLRAQHQLALVVSLEVHLFAASESSENAGCGLE